MADPEEHVSPGEQPSDGEDTEREPGTDDNPALADADVPELLVEDDQFGAFVQAGSDMQEQARDGSEHLSLPPHRKDLLEHGEGSELSSMGTSSIDAAPRRAGSPVDSITSGQDDTPSIQGSLTSSRGSSALPSVASRPGLSSPTPSFRPFDRRFQSRMSSYSYSSPRPSSPAFLQTHSRNVSLGSSFVPDHDTEASSPPWEAVRWTKLKKLTGQAFTETGRRNFGSPTCLAVSASIVLGTSKGIILVFDYSQNLKLIIGPGTKAVESGAITAIAISADHTTIAGGHANGNIFTWDTARASRPFLSIPHLEDIQVQNLTANGHIPNVAVTHLGFLGTRHTALVSADDRGMAFSHLATRGTGALGRTVKTARILGRYPNAIVPAGKPLKPSTVLGFASLPLGNVEQATDSLGLTAMLTPYLLVIVSTTPVAQTQHKSARPKDVPAHSAMTGCLAWFPAVQLKVPDPYSGSNISKTKLAYCWSNVLTVLDVEEIPGEDNDQPPTFKFKARSRWKCEESIAAVQWLGRSVLIVLTISQRLIVLEDRTMRMTEAFDLLQKHIYHSDLFSKQLHNLVERLDEDDQSMHGVVADAFYMSFKAYKGKIFLLGFGEVSIGVLSNWADRLIAMMENGDYIGAIQLATTYYTGDADKLTIGLPDDAKLRHSMVQDKIMEIVSASLKYVCGQRQGGQGSADNDQLKTLAETCFVACQAVGDTDYLFDEMYGWYENEDVAGIFLETLEPYILDGTITIIPPIVVKDLVSHYVAKGWESRLEEMICHMETATLDLDQVTLLCKQHSLYDALIYVWNQGLKDYITPMIDLLSLLVPLMVDGNYQPGDAGDDFFTINAVKVFPYLSYTLTGRVYPNGEIMDESQANKAKAEIYWFLFSGKTIEWPRDSGSEFQTCPGEDSQPAFPYLRLILRYEAPSFLSALNEAFEDSFLNDSDSLDAQVNGTSRMDMPEEQIFGITINRQYVLSILLDVMNPTDFAPGDTIYLDMFIARNLPKFPQYLLFSGSTLHKSLLRLCNYPGADLAEDAQLSAEYLLSVYHPSDTSSLIPIFETAKFYRILKRIYKVDRRYGKLISTYFDDLEDQETVFDCLADCLRPQSGLSQKEVTEVRGAAVQHAMELLILDTAKTASTLSGEADEVHHKVLDATSEEPELQHEYLQTLLEVNVKRAETLDRPGRDLIERYVKLMCRYNPSHVSSYIEKVAEVDLRLTELLPTLEQTGVVDAAIILMARDGKVRQAMDRLYKHLETLEAAMHGLLNGSGRDPQGLDFESATEDLLKSLQKYVYVGIWLCQGQTKAKPKNTKVVQKKDKSSSRTLTEDETLWLDLINACVKVTQSLSPSLIKATREAASGLDHDKLLGLLRSLVQHTFTALLTATSSHPGVGQTPKVIHHPDANISFLRILRSFLTKAAASSPNLADLRGVLASIFAAYAYEESILRLSNRLLEQSLYVDVNQSVQLRQRGWRPRGSTCEACGKRAWGPGVTGSAVFAAWEDKQSVEDARHAERKAAVADRARGDTGRAEPGGKGKGKGRASRSTSMLIEQTTQQAQQEEGEETESSAEKKAPALDSLVVLACRHVYHQSCLDSLQEKQENGTSTVVRDRDYRCPIDG